MESLLQKKLFSSKMIIELNANKNMLFYLLFMAIMDINNTEGDG